VNTATSAGDLRGGVAASAPMVSVIMSVRNEERHLSRCLRAILSQDYPSDRTEIIVVDGGSTDRTIEIIGEFARFDRRIKLLDERRERIASALNLGIRAARGDVIIRVDGHTVIASNYVSECIRTLQATGADNVGGLARNLGKGFWGEAIARATSSPFGRPGKFHRSQQPGEVETVFLGAFKREILDRVGLFDESLSGNEDFELNYRIRRAGGRIYYRPSIRRDYYTRNSLPALVRYYWGCGRAKGVVLQRHPLSAMPRQLAPPLFILAVTGALGLAASGRRFPLFSLLGSYCAASACFSRQAAPDGGIRQIGAVALVFGCMHVSWGAGLLAELATIGLRLIRRRLRRIVESAGLGA